MADIPNRKFYTLVSEPNAPTPSFPSDTEEPQNPVNPPGSGGVAIRHNSTLEKDGGDPTNDFFGHLTEEELERVQNLPDNFENDITEIEDRLTEVEGDITNIEIELDTKADKTELPIKSEVIHWGWDFSGNKNLPLPEGGEGGSWYLWDVLSINMVDMPIPQLLIGFYPDPENHRIVLQPTWTPEVGTKIIATLEFITI